MRILQSDHASVKIENKPKPKICIYKKSKKNSFAVRMEWLQ